MEHHLSWFDANAGWIGFAGLVVGVLGVLTGFIFYWLSRRPKRFGWQLMDQTPILSRSAAGLPIRIIHGDGVEAQFPQLSVIRLGNRGKAEITAHHFDGPIRVSFKRSKLIGAALHDRLGIGVTADITQEGNSATFTPSLLNKNEWFEVQFVTDGDVETPILSARVAGHDTETVEIAEKRRDFWRLVQFISGFMFVVISGTNVFAPHDWQPPGVAVTLIFGVIYFVAGRRKSKAPTWRHPRHR
ncbi:hypothetical protein KNN17_10840 [Arthrobacter bambusae]|uniref:hypothetical protein n=1 Tax=Arthrobacter bambusae TaxID=1338426 RepID=UPI001F51424E|nr:hypothetical protein [Arthrobacter bambusae]MCI0142075.1 hypothetical protein [Arthrobacter bambusae]